MDKKEIEGNYDRVVDMDVKRGAVAIRKIGSQEPKEFFYDAVYDWKYYFNNLKTLNAVEIGF